jgi:chromosome partitioning protein
MGGANIIGIVNQKGGTGKTTSCVNLGVDLAREGKRVLLVDCDPQGSLTISLGHPQPDTLPATLADQMTDVLSDSPIEPGGILHHDEGVDLLPANISLAGMEVSLVNAMSRETTLKRVLANYSKDYDHILLDCSPSLGMLTINALAAADRIIIPVQAQYLSIKGVEQLLGTVARVKANINHRLKIDGVLLTMVDSRTNNSKEIAALLLETYGSRIKIFDAEIPRSVRAAEISAEGTSIFEHDPGGKVAQAYHSLTKEVLQIEEQRQKHRTGFIR